MDKNIAFRPNASASPTDVVGPEPTMHARGCRYCGCEPSTWFLCPEDPARANLSVSPWICRDCAIKNGVFCKRHKHTHSFFSTGDTLCNSCVLAEVLLLRSISQKVMLFFNRYRQDPAIQAWPIFQDPDEDDPVEEAAALQMVAIQLVKNGIPHETFRLWLETGLDQPPESPLPALTVTS